MIIAIKGRNHNKLKLVWSFSYENFLQVATYIDFWCRFLCAFGIQY